MSKQAKEFAKFAPKLDSNNLINPAQFVGVNSMGNTKRIANYDLRARPRIPKTEVAPWSMSSYENDPWERDIFSLSK